MNLELENEDKKYERRMTLQVADRQKLSLLIGETAVVSNTVEGADGQDQNAIA